MTSIPATRTAIRCSGRWRTLQQVTASPSKIGDIARAGRCYLGGRWGGEVLGALAVAVAVHTAVPVQRLREMIYTYPAFKPPSKLPWPAWATGPGWSPCDEAQDPATWGSRWSGGRPARGRPPDICGRG